MIERLNADARRVLELAFREALTAGENHIAPEHLLSGLARYLGERTVESVPVKVSVTMDGRKPAEQVTRYTLKRGPRT